MSINVNLFLQVTCPPGSSSSGDVAEALRQFLVQEGIDDDVELTDEQGSTVTARTPYPLIISGFSRWRGPFEDTVRETVRRVAPDAVVTLDWDYPDGP